MEKYDKIHLWIGNSNKSENEYLDYFQLDYSTDGDFENPNYRVCQFCKDIGEVWYDEDFIGIIPRCDKEVDLDRILRESSIDKKEWDRIKKICKGYKIEKANAMFWYADADLVILKPYKESYNDLKYIGMFNGD